MSENQGSAPSTKAIVFFDSNLPQMDDCGSDCEIRKKVLCKHRFESSPEVVYCNTGLFSGLQDIEMVIYFINYILSQWPSVNAENELVVIVLTHDEDFTKDVKRQWIKKKQQLNPHLKLDFFDESISVSFSFTAFSFDLVIKTIKAVKYGTSRDEDRQKAIEVVNKTVTDETKASY